MKIEQQLESLGWDLEKITCFELVNGTATPSYRAFQGGFKTQWREKIEHVLEDVKKIRS